MSSAPSVFISYSRRSSAQEATALKDVLGDDAFLDTSEIVHGQDFVDSIASSLFSARVFVAFVDGSYFGSWYCAKEWALATAAWRHVLETGSSLVSAEEAIAPLILARGVDTRAVDWCLVPPLLRNVNWAPPQAIRRLAEQARRQRDATSMSLGERLQRLGIRERASASFGNTSQMPEPGSLQGIPQYPSEPARNTLRDGFVGRATQLWRLDAMLMPTQGDPGSSAGLTAAVGGGGGFGKSQLAAEYLHRFGPTRYRGGIFWIDASFG